MEIAAFAPRAACSDVERRAAVWAHDELRGRGHEAWVETHWVRPQLALALALGCALAAPGGLVAIAAPVPRLAMAATGAVSVLVDVPGRGLAARLAGVPGGLRWLVLCALAIVAAAAARVAGADGLALGIAQLVPTIVLMLAVGGALDA